MFVSGCLLVVVQGTGDGGYVEECEMGAPCAWAGEEAGEALGCVAVQTEHVIQGHTAR
jgi:hypothetical protein